MVLLLIKLIVVTAVDLKYLSDLLDLQAGFALYY